MPRAAFGGGQRVFPNNRLHHHLEDRTPDTVYFQNQVLPILIFNCTKGGGHNAQDREKRVVLDSYQNLMNTVEKVSSTDWKKNELMEVIL